MTENKNIQKLNENTISFGGLIALALGTAMLAMLYAKEGPIGFLITLCWLLPLCCGLAYVILKIEG